MQTIAGAPNHGFQEIRAKRVDRTSIKGRNRSMEDRIVRSAGRPPWVLGGTTGIGCLLTADCYLQHPSPAALALWCAFAAITVGAWTWRFYVQVQVDREWLRCLRGGDHPGPSNLVR
jgi:hypothetical protein